MGQHIAFKADGTILEFFIRFPLNDSRENMSSILLASHFCSALSTCPPFEHPLKQ